MITQTTFSTPHPAAVAVAGGQVSLLRVGAESGSPNVIYLHGYPGSAIEVVVADRAAQELGLQVLAFDRPGFGHSTFYPFKTYSQFAIWFSALLDQLHLDRCALIGVSGGVPFALAALSHLGNRISCAALASGMGASRSALATMSPLNRLMVKLGSTSPKLAKLPLRVIVSWLKADPERILWWFDRCLDPPDRLLFRDPSVREMMKSNIKRALCSGHFGDGLSYAGPLQELLLFSHGWDFEISHTTTPVKFWHGELDRYVPPEMSIQSAKLFKSAQVEIVPGGAHFMALEIIAEILEWVKRNSLASL